MVGQTTRTGMSLADFIEQYNQQPFEMVHGEIRALSPNVSGHQWVSRTLFRLLDTYLRQSKLGELVWETPFVLQDEPDWVTGSRTPDLAFFTRERWTAYVAAVPDWRGKPLILVPDLVVEIVSPNDRYSEIQDKIDGYFGDGVQIAWVIDPQRRRVAIHRSDSDQQTMLRETGTLTGGDLMPGFSVSVRTLFE